MKNLKLIAPIFIALLLTGSALAQSRFYGKVTEVIDGKTLVVEPQPQVTIRIELQYIEVPEAEQQLHNLIKNHLSGLVLNKNVEFRPKNINETAKPIGQVLLNGVDISQQMLRDGAAWYSSAEKDIQGPAESKVYQYNESLAKNEKRGVWSIADLKPAWEFRAEKEEKIRQEKLKKKEEEEAKQKALNAERNRKAKQKTIPTEQPQQTSRFGIEEWSNEIPYKKVATEGIVITKGQYDLWYLQDAIKDEGWVGTQIMTFNVFDKDETKEIFFGVGYDYKGKTLQKGGDKFSLAIGSNNNDTPFLKNGFYIEVDGKKKEFITKKEYKLNQAIEGYSEFYVYEITRSDLAQLSNGKSLVVVVGKYRRKISKDIKDSLWAIADATAV